MTEEVVRELTISFFRRYEVVLTTEALLLEASGLREAYSLSYWDSLIVAAALQAKATTLLSEDMHDGLIVDGALTITTPFARARSAD